MNPDQARINELKALMAANARRNNKIFEKMHQLDQHLLFENIRMKDELGRLSSAKNLDLGVMA